MWIETTRFTSAGKPVTSKIVVNGYRIDFTENGKAQVPGGIGEKAISEYGHIKQVTNDGNTES